MLDRLLKFEERISRVETWLLVALVLLMLFLAIYNVFYRNVLVPVQVSLNREVVVQPEPARPDQEKGGGAKSETNSGGFGGGFGGGFDEATDDSAPADHPDEAADQPAGGFGGGFGDDEAATDGGTGGSTGDEAGGFGGGFGGGFDDGGSAGGTHGAAKAAPDTPEEPETYTETRPPEEGTFAAAVYGAIDAVKLEWIDVLLRQLVLIVGFLGAMLATRRRKHITVDALTKVLPEAALGWVTVATNLLALTVTSFLAVAGGELVSVSMQFPRDLMSWAPEWAFQLAFPVGFGLLGFHFLVRVIESVVHAIHGEGPPEKVAPADVSSDIAVVGGDT